MSLRKNAGMLALAITMMTGCPTPQQEGGASDYRSQAVRAGNGASINGPGINGPGINGPGINGPGINGPGLNGSTINGPGTNGPGTNGPGTNGPGINGSGTNGTGVAGLTLTSVTYNGPGLNGSGTNGSGTNGSGTNGSGTNGSGTNGTAVTGLWLNGSEMYAVVSGQTLTGTAVVGIEFHYSYQAPATSAPFLFTVRIDSAGLDSTAKIPVGQPNDVWMYNMIWRQDSVTPAPAWQSLCTSEVGAPDQALMLSNRWDPVTANRIDQPTFITFACRDFALGKCARLGYRPWAKGTTCTGAGSQRKCTDIALTDHHQSCVRMMRADYCGTGKSYTVNGTLIDIYDYLNPPIQVPETHWDIEARWTPTGAICINEPRHPELVGKWKRPDCNGDGKPDNFPACGQSDNRYSGKGLVVDRFNDDQSGCGK